MLSFKNSLQKIGLRYFIVFIVPLLLLTSSLCKAADTPTTSTDTATSNAQATFQRNLEMEGLNYQVSGGNLDINIDQGRSLESIPKLKSLGYLTKNLTQQDISQKPTLLAFTIGIIFTTAIIHFNYDTNKSLDKVRVNAYIVKPDHSKKLCYVFDFNRKLFNQAHWNNMSYTDFIKSTPDFTITEWCRGQMDAEMKKK